MLGIGWLGWLVAGIVVGWAIEWVIDWWYWRRRTDRLVIEAERGRAAQTELAGVRAERDRLAVDLRACGERSTALNAQLDGVRAELESLRAERDRLAVDLRACGERGTALSADLQAARSQVLELEPLRAQVLELEPLRARVGALEESNQRLVASLAAAQSTPVGQGLVLGSLDAASADRHLVVGGEDASFGFMAREVGGSGGESLRAQTMLLNDELAATRRALLRLGKGRGDPLIDIDGIGPVYQDKLYEAGVISFDQLGAMRPEQIRGIVGRGLLGTLDVDAWIAEARARAGTPRRDPLIDINGIGPVYEQRLISAGVTSFEQLADMTPEAIRAVIQPQSWQQFEPEAWIAEARELAAQVRAGTYRKGES